MALMDDLNEYIDFCDDLIRELKDTKASDYKMGVADGMEQAISMLCDYLVEYPGFIDPKHKFDKFKM